MKDKGLYKPSDYLIQLFKTNDLILLGEDHGVKDNLDFLASMIPILYKNGIRNIVMEFGASEDQAVLDDLVTGERFNEDLARELIFRYNVIFPYKEYWLLYKAVWDFNKSLQTNEPTFRIVNMSYIYDWSASPGPEYVDHPDTVRKIFHKGTIEAFRADIIEKEVIEKQEKALILTGTIHAYSHFFLPVFDYLHKDFIRTIDTHLGNLLFKRFPNGVKTVALHQPFYKDGKRINQGLTIDQHLEALYLESKADTMAIDFEESEYGNLIDHSYLALGNDALKLKEIVQGYIILNPLSKLTGCTVDHTFLDNHTLSEVLNQWPDPNWHAPVDSLTNYWQLVETYVDLSIRYADYYTKENK